MEPSEEQGDTFDHVCAMLTRCMALLKSKRAGTVATGEPSTAPDLTDFTARELEFLRLVRKPDTWSYNYIAALMGMRLPTLHYMRRKLFAKLQVNSRIALVIKVRDWPLDVAS